ncbi:MAG TPA: DUF1598 domain-containing protein [Pirellulales bacterium]|nr:DUF1598 domain-containing protein [Pirellulales bacterium]
MKTAAFCRLACLLSLFLLLLETTASAQCCGGGGRGRRQSVGGVYVDALGMLSNAEIDDRDQLRQTLLRALAEQPGDLIQPADLRKVSLRRLEQAIDEQLRTGKDPSDEMRYLAGLQTIEYVFVYPEQHDIVLAGFGEGWTIDSQGFVVGRTTGRPVLLLDDLMVALRNARRNQESGISCSIDPTQEGLASLRQFASSLIALNNDTIQQIEHLLGPQVVSVTGIPATSHFARVLVAADYRMKRLGMALDPSPLGKRLTSYVEMIPVAGRGMQSMTPRWWLVPNYAPLLTNADRTAWQLRGGSVKCMTEDSLFAADGSKVATGKTSSAAQLWAQAMTTRYDELAAKEPIFAQLRSCMDMAIVAAIITAQDLPAKAGYSFSLLTDPTQLATDEYDAPRTTASRASVIKRANGYIVSASGGVEIRTDELLEKIEQSPTLDPAARAAAPAAETRWWWN